MARRFRGTRTPRMNRYWVNSFDAQTFRRDTEIKLSFPVGALPAGSIVSQAFYTDAALEDITLARTFMHYAVRFQTTNWASLLVNLAIGMAVVPPGTTTVEPVRSADWDGWLFHRWLRVRNEFIGQSGGATNALRGPVSPTEESGYADIKAKRRVPQGSQLVVVASAETSAEVVLAEDAALDLPFTFRALIMER